MRSLPERLLRSIPDSAAQTDPHSDQVEAIAILAAAILRRWRIVALVALVMVVFVYAVVQAIDDKYDVEASLLVKVGRENLEVPAVVAAGSLVSTGVRKEDINSDVTLLGARALIEQTVDDIGIDAFRPQSRPAVTLFQRVRRQIREGLTAVVNLTERILIAMRLTKEQTLRDKIVTEVENGLYARRGGESDVILLTLTFPNPDLGMRFLERHIQNFLAQRAIAHRSFGGADFFNDQVAAAGAQLAELDAKILDLRTSQRLTSVTAERDHLLNRVAELDTAIASAASAAAMAESLDSFVPTDTEAAEAGGGASPSAVRARISELIIERANLLDSYAGGGKPLQEIEGRIGQLAVLLKRSAAKEIAQLSSEQAKVAKRLAALNDGELKLERLELERELTQTRYGEYQKQREVATVTAELERRRVANVVVLSEPTRPPLPSAPQKLMIVLVTLPLGLILGIALAALLALLDQRIFTERELARVRGLTPLGSFRLGGSHHG